MLSRLFKRKPQTTDADPAHRREALLALDDSEQSVLEEAARTDADAGVRTAAIARLQSIDALGSLLDETEVASAAASRLAKLGDDHAFADHPHVVVARFVLKPSADLLSRIDDDELGLAIAGLPDVQTRVAMAQEVRGENRLTVLEHALRSGDKTAHRVVREKLNALKGLKHAREELVARAEELVEAADRLSAGDVQFDAKRNALQVEWDALSASMGRTPANSKPRVGWQKRQPTWRRDSSYRMCRDRRPAAIRSMAC